MVTMDGNLVTLLIQGEVAPRHQEAQRPLDILIVDLMEQLAILVTEEQEDYLHITVLVLVAEVDGMELQEPVVPALAHSLVPVDPPLFLGIRGATE